MWQDFVISGVSFLFGLLLVPTLLDSSSRVSGFTSFPTFGGLVVLGFVYLSLGLWFSVFSCFLSGFLWLLVFVFRR